MKRLLAMLLLGLCASAMAPAQNSNPVSPIGQENANKAKAILNEAIAALGGPAYMNIQDITQQGRTYSFHMGVSNSAGLDFWRFYKYPDKDRYELTPQRDIVEVYNGDKAVEVTYRGIHKQEAKDIEGYERRRFYALDWVLRHWLTQPGVALFYENQTVADGKSVDQVTIMNADNDAVTLYFDVDTHLPVKKSFNWRDPADKQRNVEEETYDNYRPTQGIMTPYTVTRYYNGDMSNQRFLTGVKYNQGLSDSLFDTVHATLPSKKDKQQ
jgi:hypothetical protein